MTRAAVLGLAALALLPAGGANATETRSGLSFGVYGDVERFDRLTGQETDSGLVHLGWDQGRTWGSRYSYFLDSLGDRPHIALQAKTIKPREIARGRGDAHLIGLAKAIAESGRPVVLRPLGEMNNHKSAYSAFNANGSRRDPGRSARWYRKAFQRIYLITHGGTAAALSTKLRALGLPGVAEDVPANPSPHLTIVWNPLAVGDPAVRGNHYRDYNPGLRFFDAYGNDYYNTTGVYAFHRTEELYRAYPRKPFAVPEWGLTIDDPGYVRSFAAFVRNHGRVRFVSFYNGRAGSAFDLSRKPRALAAYRRYVAPLSRS